MSKIVPKLNLNKTPQNVEPYSMVFAKNIKLLKDGSLGRDDGVRLIKQELNESYLLGTIPYNRKVYLFYRYKIKGISKYFYAIYEYNEDTDSFTEITANWKWGGGVISGYASINLRNETLLTIIESFNEPTDNLVPIKTINLSHCSKTDDESIYTQTPNIPIINLDCIGSYNSIIPNGTYQFFIRYEIKKDLYSDWMPASRELSTANIFENDTLQGRVRYIKTTQDSNNSFIFRVDQIDDLQPEYEAFQIGFILAHDDSIVARSWKKFSLDTEVVYFDYDKEYITEIDVTDLFKPVFGLYNIGNITAFKNKLYISNYTETNYDEDYADYAKEWEVNAEYINIEEKVDYTFLGLPCETQTIGESKVLTQVNGEAIYDYLFDNEDFFTSFKHGQFDSSTKNEKVKKSSTQLGNYNSVNQLLDSVDNKVGNSYYTQVAKGFEVKVEDIECCYSDDNFTINTVGPESYRINKNVCDELKGSFFGFNVDTKNGVYDTSEGQNESNSFVIIYTLSEVEIITNPDGTYTGVHTTYQVKETVYLQLKPNSITKKGFISETNQMTLMPYQKYKFFIHFVQQNGVISNGYPIGGEHSVLTVPYIEDYAKQHYAIVPRFYTDPDNTLPANCVAYFFSIAKYGNTVAELFNLKKIPGNDDSCYLDCLDIDTLQLPLHTDIKVIVPENGTDYSKCVTYIGEYIDSGEMKVDSELAFGASGKVKLNTNGNFISDKQLFLIIDSIKEEKNLVLTKCTKYFNKEITETNEVVDANTLSYLCKINKDVSNEFDTFISGSDVYDKVLEEDTETGYKYASIVSKNGVVQTTVSNSRYIYSNFNLNFLELTNDISEQFRSWTETVQNKDVLKKQLINSFNSLTLSDLYTLPSMYKNITRRIYQKYDENAIITFNNTIRRSKLETDESKTYIYTFKIEDTYNVPTNKGYITNLASLGDVIIVHTEDSIFKFTGKISFSKQDNTVQTVESDVFDTGCSEVTSSAYGFGGLKNKDHALGCQYGYIFWDQDANVIYLYSGEGQLAAISDSISKLFIDHKPVDIRFACDYYNDRFFIRIKFEDYEDEECYSTLTYNVLAKSIVSLHDFTYDYSFNTKTGVYFIKSTNNDDNKRGGYLFKLDSESVVYGNDNVNLLFDDLCYPFKNITETINKYAIVDIIYNLNYENIKTLNSINWIANSILYHTYHYDDDPINLVNLAEEIFRDNYAGNYLSVYSDSCATELIDIIKASNNYAFFKKFEDGTYKEVDENKRPVNPSELDIRGISESYKLPRYNLGKWDLNYFRNIKNTDNITKVPPTTPGYIQDNQSLIYGKYFVIRFIFNPLADFKFENVEFNITHSNYGNF